MLCPDAKWFFLLLMVICSAQFMPNDYSDDEQPQSIVQPVLNGQSLLTFLRSANISNGTLTLQLQRAEGQNAPNIVFNMSTSDSMLVPSAAAMTTGTIVIMPEALQANDGQPSRFIIDFGGRERITANMQNMLARMRIRDLSIVGMCYRFFPAAYWLLAPSGTFWSAYTATQIYWVNQQVLPFPLVQRINFTRVTLHTGLGDVRMYQFLFSLQQSAAAFAQLKPFWDRWLAAVANPNSMMRRMTRDAVEIGMTDTPGWHAVNLTLTASLEDLGLAPGSVTRRLCQGPEGGGRVLSDADVAASGAPLWPVGSAEELDQVVQLVAAYQPIAPQGDTPLVILLLSSLELAPDIPSHPQPTTPPRVTFAHVILRRAINPDHAPILDLGTRWQPLFELAANATGTARLYVQGLTLKGLGAQAVQAVPQNSSTPPVVCGPTYNTSLPLWAFGQAARDRVQVALADVTLVLPQAEYMALVSAALRGPGAWRTGANATSILLSGITKFELATQVVTSGDTPLPPSLLLSTYTGWGVAATNLRLTPDTPLPACGQLDLPDWGVWRGSPCDSDPPPPPAPVAGGGSSGLSRARRMAIGVGVGVGAGGGLLLLAAGAVLLIRSAHQRRRLRADQEAAAKSSSPANSTMHTTGSGAGTRSQLGQLGQLPPSSHGSPGFSTTANAVFGTTMNTLQGTQQLLTLLNAYESRVSSGNSRGSGKVGSLQANSSSNPPPDHREAVGEVAATLDVGQADKVTLSAVIGKGAWGKVYRGRWRGLDVAVKTMLFSSERTELESSRPVPMDAAVKEASICLAVSHRNVVATYHYDIKRMETLDVTRSCAMLEVTDAGSTQVADFKLFLIQELCTTTLHEASEKGGFHTPDGSPILPLVLWAVADMARGLAHLHAKSIVHGDLKPTNVLLKPEPGCPAGFVAKLADFGLSQTMDPGATHVSRFHAGTPYYVAPEVVELGHGTPAADVYSLGVILWSLYTHDFPFTYNAAAGAFNPNPHFPSLPPATLPALGHLITACLSRDPRARPTSSVIHTTAVACLAERGVVYGSGGEAQGVPETQLHASASEHSVPSSVTGPRAQLYASSVSDYAAPRSGVGGGNSGPASKVSRPASRTSGPLNLNLVPGLQQSSGPGMPMSQDVATGGPSSPVAGPPTVPGSWEEVRTSHSTRRTSHSSCTIPLNATSLLHEAHDIPGTEQALAGGPPRMATTIPDLPSACLLPTSHMGGASNLSSVSNAQSSHPHTGSSTSVATHASPKLSGGAQGSVASAHPSPAPSLPTAGAGQGSAAGNAGDQAGHLQAAIMELPLVKD